LPTATSTTIATIQPLLQLPIHCHHYSIIATIPTPLPSPVMMLAATESGNKQAALQNLANFAGTSAILCNLIANAALPGDAEKAANALSSQLKEWTEEPIADILSELKDWSLVNRISENLTKAIKTWSAEQDWRRSLHRKYALSLRLNYKPAHRNAFLDTLDSLSVTALSTSYPPYKHWVCETAEIRNKWEEHILYSKQPDVRQPRRDQITIINPHLLKHNIPPNQSVIIREGEQVVGLVIRNFCPDDQVLWWADKIVQDTVEAKTCARVCDHLFHFF
jgi:hypothetical protein